MRDIKFRVWDNERNAMFNSKSVDIDFFEGKIEITSDTIRYDEVYTDEIKDFELMQYTGVKDKNGREIYEGDIVEYKNEYHVIEWDDCKFMAKGFYCSSQDTPDDFFSEFAYTNCKVIGNIYENSELLERK